MSGLLAASGHRELLIRQKSSDHSSRTLKKRLQRLCQTVWLPFEPRVSIIQRNYDCFYV